MPKKIKVREVMSLDVQTVHPSTTLEQALNMMLLHNIKRLPVLDHTGTLVGLVTDRDLRLISDSPLLSIPPEMSAQLFHEHYVSEVMQVDLCTVHEEQPLWEAADAMRIHDIGGLPVIDDQGLLIGIVTRTDLLNVLLEMLDPLNDEIVLLLNPIPVPKAAEESLASSPELPNSELAGEREQMRSHTRIVDAESGWEWKAF